MADSLSESETSLLSMLPRCCGCNQLLHQLSSAILLPCAHFLYCQTCYLATLRVMDGVVTCNLCGLEFAELEREGKLEAVGEEIRQLYEWERESEKREDRLKEVMLEVRLVYESYLNPSESRKSDTEPASAVEETPRTKDLAKLPASFLPDEGNFQCEWCGLPLPEEQFRCSCGFVDFVTYTAYHPKQLKAISITASGLIEGEEGNSGEEEQGEEQAGKEQEEGLDEGSDIKIVPEDAKQHADYQSFTDDPDPLENSKPAASEAPAVHKSLLALGRPPWEEEQPESKVPWRLLGVILVVLLLIFDIYQVNVDAAEGNS